MRLYSMTRLYDGLVSDMKIFTTYNEMKRYCDEAVENEDVAYQDISYYPDHGQEYAYLSNDYEKERHSLEIVIWPIEVDGIVLKKAGDDENIIHCKNCKYNDTYYNATTDTMPLKCLSIRYGGVCPDWYCEHGEQKEIKENNNGNS